jgi:hypothetical protein
MGRVAKADRRGRRCHAPQYRPHFGHVDAEPLVGQGADDAGGHGKAVESNPGGRFGSGTAVGRQGHEPHDEQYQTQCCKRARRRHERRERRKNQAENENDREPDPPHGHLV